MRFQGERHLRTSVEHVRTALHDPEVLRRVIPGCREMVGVGTDRFAATLGVQVGPMADTYRGTFTVSSTPTGLRVAVEARGRCGRLELDLQTHLGTSRGGTRLRYVADAHVRGLVARLGGPTLTVVGGHLTNTFFRDLERALATERVASLV